MVVTFLELFMESRPLYAGARRAGVRALYAAQHAAYCSEKTFGSLDSEIEAKGIPDNCPMPVPDGVFTMGELSHSLWLKNGFPPGNVIKTGGLRYQYVSLRDAGGSGSAEEKVVLLICGMNEYLDFDMCEAVCRATEGLSGIKLRIRNHPSYWITDMEGFAKYRSRIEVSSVRDAMEDVGSADLVLFTHSSLAEEALIMGVPIWQWLWAGFNTSVFVDIPGISVFMSVSTLRDEIKKFLADPGLFRPSIGFRQNIMELCYGAEPSKASVKVASEIERILGEGKRCVG